MFYIFSVLEVLWQDLSVTRILPERHKDTRASQGVRSRAPESRALHHDHVQPGTRTIHSSTSNNIPEWAWFHQLFQVLCQLFHFTLLECIYWHTFFSPSATPSASLVHWGSVALHNDSNSKVSVHKVSLSHVNEIQEEQERLRKARPEIPDGEQSSLQGCRQNFAASSRCFEHELWLNIWEQSLSL